MAGTGLFTLNAAAPEVPPPGDGFCTVTRLAELPARSAAGRVAFTSVALTNVVLSGVPFHVIAEEETNPEPVTSSGVSEEPASTLEGVIVLIAGEGLFTEKSTADESASSGRGIGHRELGNRGGGQTARRNGCVQSRGRAEGCGDR